MTSVLSSLPSAPELPTYQINHILELWDFKNQALEVTSFFQALFSRLPPYFLAFFALALMFVVVPLIIRVVTEIL